MGPSGRDRGYGSISEQQGVEDPAPIGEQEAAAHGGQLERKPVAADPKVANRLSMWGRRLVGEGISQAVRVAGERPALAALIASNPGSDVHTLLARLTSAHTERMASVGLNN